VALAQIGPITFVVEAVATAVGAGIVLGSFGIGTVRLLRGWPRQVVEAHVLTDGYFGGGLGVFVVLVDPALRYGG
jgi:hypothetical protein